MADLVYTPRDHFIPFHNRPERWASVVTHRRAGKTVALVNDVILAARTPIGKPAPQYAYMGPTFTQSKRIAWKYLKAYSRPHWAKDPSESELKINLKNDTTIYCLGADNADSLRGFYLDGAVMDEYAMWKPSVFTQIIRPALSDRGGWGVFASTPRGRNLFHKVVRAAQLDPKTWHLTQLRASTSGIIPASELRELQKDMDQEEYAQEYECSFDSALKGAIFANEVNNLMAEGRAYNFEGDWTSPLYNPALDTHFIYDLGFTDSTVRIAWQYDRGQVNIVNVEATSGTDIFYHIESLHKFADAVRGQKGGIGKVYLPHDARAKNLQTGKSVVEQFLAEGITPELVPDHHVRDGIAAARRLFPLVTIDMTPAAADTPDVPVTGDLLEALKAYRREWDEDHLIFVDKPVHDWSSDFCDAFRYLAVVATPHLNISASSDDATQRVRGERGRIWTPTIGYNLETLHADRAIRQESRRIA